MPPANHLPQLGPAVNSYRPEILCGAWILSDLTVLFAISPVILCHSAADDLQVYSKASVYDTRTAEDELDISRYGK